MKADEIRFFLIDTGVPFEEEYRFYDGRRWRFDYALPLHKIAIEYEGGTWNNGRHTRGAGYDKDCEKYNQASADGWNVLRFTASYLDLDLLSKLIKKKKKKKEKQKKRGQET